VESREDVEDIRADVDPRLDREGAAGGDHGQVGVVDFEADAVSEAMHVEQVVLWALRCLAAEITIVARDRRFDEAESR